MAYYKITSNKRGELVAKIQVSGKDVKTGETKLFTTRVYNTDNLTEAKFRKYIDKQSIIFEEEVKRAYEEGTTQIREKVLTFGELMKEWQQTIHANLSQNYYERACEVDEKFTLYLKQRNLADKPISAITVRDVQLFLDSFAKCPYNAGSYVKLKKELPSNVNYRELARLGIINRCTSYNVRHNKANVAKRTAVKICDYYKLNYDDYFESAAHNKQYAQETIKGYRRVLRTLFNEAVRYEWITKNPVCSTKVSSGSSNTSLRPVEEKEVFSFKETQRLLKDINSLDERNINYRIMVEILLLTGVRNAELHGLHWADIDFEKRTLHVNRNRLYSQKCGYYEKLPKTKKSIREIPMPDLLVDDLIMFREWFKEAYPDVEDNPDKYYVAVNLKREPEYPQSIGNWLTAYETKHGYKRVTCHGLRHTYCSLLLAQNVPIQTVSNYMGHSDSTVTLKIYSHFIPDTQEKVVNALNFLTT